MTPQERTHRARMAGLARALKDPEGRAAALAREGLEAKWLRQARELYPYAPEWQVQRAAATLRRMHYARMSRAGVLARAAR